MFGINISVSSGLYRSYVSQVEIINLTQELGFDWRKAEMAEFGVDLSTINFGQSTPVVDYFNYKLGGAESLDVEEWLVSQMSHLDDVQARAIVYKIQEKVLNLSTDYREVKFI